MNRVYLRWAVLAAGLALVAGDANACTTVCFTDKATPVVAYNYDFHSGDGLVLVNPRGLAKTSVLDGKPHAWTSRFGSLTFNQYGRDQPMTGINERGLVVAQMWLEEGKYPGPVLGRRSASSSGSSFSSIPRPRSPRFSPSRARCASARASRCTTSPPTGRATSP
jgi:penicillin V acylase-like amidase (Ntn superfamily)